ncbi:MAG: MBL fold metallo-hydrolase, partial [Metallosphaera sp.]
MKITFLGTGAGSTAGSRRFKAGILVEGKEGKIVLDFGSGINMRLEDMRVVPDAVFITHLHIDHFSGIFDHLVRRQIDRVPELKVFSPPGFSEVLRVYQKTNNISAQVMEDHLPSGKIGDLEVYSLEACHKIYAVSYIITDGKRRVLYSGDTLEPCDTVLREISGVDLVIHEASCLENCKEWGHTSVKEAINLFRNPVLTHVPAQLEGEVENSVKGKALLAKDGL